MFILPTVLALLCQDMPLRKRDVYPEQVRALLHSARKKEVTFVTLGKMTNIRETKVPSPEPFPESMSSFISVSTPSSSHLGYLTRYLLM